MHTRSKRPFVTSSDDAYVHDPDAFDEDGVSRSTADESGTGTEHGTGAGTGRDESVPDVDDREFGTRGWILVGMIVLAFIVSPVAILLIPPGTDYLFALIILPLFPAIALALTAVWAAGNS